MNESIQRDIRTMVGGNFTPDALGPEAYQGILTRARSHPDEYLREFEELFLGLNFDAVAQSRLHLPSFLELLQSRDPSRVRLTAKRLLKQYDAVLILYDAARDQTALLALVPEEMVRLVQRLNTRRTQLRLLER